MANSEQRLRTRCIAFAKACGWTHIRLHFGRGAAKGWPDDLFLKRPGRLVFVEFKAPGKEAKPIQHYRIGALQSMAFHAFLCDDYHYFVRQITQ